MANKNDLSICSSCYYFLLPTNFKSRLSVCLIFGFSEVHFSSVALCSVELYGSV